MTDQEAREAIRNRLDVTMLVEAAAGTGKTTSLVARMVNLVATGRARASTIAAITFTVKAAAHLREQFQEEIESVILRQGTAPDEPVTRPSPGASRHPLPAARGEGSPMRSFSPPRGEKVAEGRMRGALAEIDRGFIGTTHAFCARLLRERP